MELQVVNANTVKVSEEAFGVSFNEGLVHQVVTAYLAGARAGTRAQKNRSAVRGGGAKPWRQKGTGRARAGTSRSPIWTGGGVTFASQPQDFSQKVNRKMYRAGMRAILSELVRNDRLVVVEELALSAPKTKELLTKLADLDAPQALIVVKELDEKLYLASRNPVGVHACDVAALNPALLVGSEKVVMTVDAVRQVEEWLG